MIVHSSGSFPPTPHPSSGTRHISCSLRKQHIGREHRLEIKPLTDLQIESLMHHRIHTLLISLCWLITNFSSTERAVKDCTYVIHVASPFPAENPRDEMEVIRPAVEGTTNVLEACASTKGGVKRVVLTSSCAAIYGETVYCSFLFQYGHMYQYQNRLSKVTAAMSLLIIYPTQW